MRMCVQVTTPLFKCNNYQWDFVLSASEPFLVSFVENFEISVDNVAVISVNLVTVFFQLFKKNNRKN